jgi:hypothetical protein
MNLKHMGLSILIAGTIRAKRGNCLLPAAAAGMVATDRSQSTLSNHLRDTMRRYLIAALTLALGLAVLGLAANAADKDTPKKEPPIVKPLEGKSETIKLFNGKDLDGWEGNDSRWSVKDGVIVGKNTDEVTISTYLLTKKKYSDFRLTATVKLVQSKMHSGIAFWGRNAPEQGKKDDKDAQYTYAGHLVMFPFGWGMYDLFGRNGLPVDGGPAKKVGKDDDWNELEILAQGNRVRVAVNGTQVVDWRDPEPERIKEAPIGLQLHKNNVPQEVHFKDLTLTTFPKEDKLITVKEKEKGTDK